MSVVSWLGNAAASLVAVIANARRPPPAWVPVEHNLNSAGLFMELVTANADLVAKFAACNVHNSVANLATGGVNSGSLGVIFTFGNVTAQAFDKQLKPLIELFNDVSSVATSVTIFKALRPAYRVTRIFESHAMILQICYPICNAV